MTQPEKHWNLKTCADQLEKCGYECEAGKIDTNDAFLWLKQASIVGPEFLPGQGVWFKVEAEAAGKKLKQFMHFYIVGCSMDADTERRFWTYSLSYDPPRPWHYGEVHYRGIKGDRLHLDKPVEVTL